MTVSALFARRSIELRALAIAVVTTLGVTACAFFLLYRTNLAARRVQLVEMARSQARLMESVAKFDAFFHSGQVTGAARSATLSQIREGHRRYTGFGETGEIVLAERHGDEIVFLLPTRKRDFRVPPPMHFESERGGPMRLALEGSSGVVVDSIDNSGAAVLAAYEWLPFLEMGLVCKLDMAEIRAPFWRAALITSAVALALILAGAGLTSRMVSPLVARLEESKAEVERELRVARALGAEIDREHDVALVGESAAVRGLREAMARHAASDEPLLLTGPPGAGQQAVARGVHKLSARSARPFIYVDCGRLAASGTDLAPGVRETSLGQMGLAEGGTLYLENLQELPPEAQKRLLERLQAAARRRAADARPEPDVRIVAYSAGGFDEAVQTAQLYPELAQAVGHQRLAVPALAERREDVPAIAQRVVRDRARARGQVFDGIDPDSLRRMIDYAWPGNVVELRNVLERSLVIARGSLVEVRDELLDHGVRVGGYRLIRKLGDGGMGDVWLARHDLLARPAAVKLIRAELLSMDAETRTRLERRFEREAQVTAQLRSPHTVELYDFGIGEAGEIYYAMEYLEGTELGKLVESHGALEPARVVYLLAQACLSLAEAHEAGLVHRDIKPANLFVCRLGPQRDFLKILDFGIVKSLRPERTQMTRTGATPGTPGYLSPEVALGTSEADGRSDLYALGCIAHLMLTGQPLVRSPMDLARVQTQPPEPPSSVAAGTIPAELDDIVMRCLARDPGERPASALELRALLLAVPLAEPWSEERAADWWAGCDPLGEADTLLGGG